jgi:hypothetical protein
MLSLNKLNMLLTSSVGDPDPEPDPQDPYLFGPPGSINRRFESGSVSFFFLISVWSELK